VEEFMISNKKVRQSISRENVISLIENYWPISVSEVAEKLGLISEDEYRNKISINAVRYHFSVLEKKGKISTKKIGRNLVAWPKSLEKIRRIKELVRDI
jgi:predicted transcriptional regulator